MFSLINLHYYAIDSEPQFYVSSKIQEQKMEQKLWKKSHIDLLILDSASNFPVIIQTLYELSYRGSRSPSTCKTQR